MIVTESTEGDRLELGQVPDTVLYDEKLITRASASFQPFKSWPVYNYHGYLLILFFSSKIKNSFNNVATSFPATEIPKFFLPTEIL